MSMGSGGDYSPALSKTLPSEEGPLVSVIMPTYEDAHYIDRALVSLADQTYTNLEAVVVDSSNVEWLEDLVSALEWGTYIYEPPQGVAAARNRGIEAAEGDVIAFLDADDYYAPEKLARQVEKLNTGPDVVYSNVVVVNEDGTRTELSSMPVKDSETHYIDFFRTGHGVPTVTVAARRECFENERFDESLDAREDPHLWVRLFRKCTPARIPDALAYKRRRAGSLTSDPDMMFENEMAAIADLTERCEELRLYRDERERMAKYRYAKHLLHAGRIREARRAALSVMITGMVNHQTVALFAVSLLPTGNQRAFQLLEKAQESVRTLLR